MARHASRGDNSQSHSGDEGSVVVTGADDRCVRVWCSSSSSSDRWQLLHTLRAHDGRVWGVDCIIATDGGILVASCGEDGRCCVWGEAGGQVLANEVIIGGGGGGDVWAVEFGQGGALVVFACGDGTARY